MVQCALITIRIVTRTSKGVGRVHIGRDAQEQPNIDQRKQAKLWISVQAWNIASVTWTLFRQLNSG